MKMRRAIGCLSQKFFRQLIICSLFIFGWVLPATASDADLTACAMGTSKNRRLTAYATNKLKNIHSNLQILHGSLTEEYPEQLMTTMFLPPHAKVLELGGNIGRNSCVIASILQDQKNLVVIEPCKEFARLLQENRDRNGLRFYIETSALSKVPLIQAGWVSSPSIVDVYPSNLKSWLRKPR